MEYPDVLFACMCVYECVWVFIGSQWVEQSSWPHFLAVVDRETFRPGALETRHCLEELPVTAAYNHSIYHCFNSFFFVCIFLSIRQSLIQSFWTMRSGPDCKGEPQTWKAAPINSCCHERCRISVTEHTQLTTQLCTCSEISWTLHE